MRYPAVLNIPCLLAIAAAGTLFMALTACGGGDVSGGAAATGTTSAPQAAATRRPSSNQPVTLLADLSSYKYTLTISGKGGPVSAFAGGTGPSSFSVTGAYIKPDRQRISLKLGDQTSETVIAGGQLWSIVGGTVQPPVPAQSNSLRLTNPVLAFWDGGPLREIILDFDCSGAPSAVNGAQARKCTLDKAGYERVAKTWGDFLGGFVHQSYSRASAEVWMATAGYPVRMRLDVAGKDKDGADFDYKLEMDLTDVNASFVIEPPR